MKKIISLFLIGCLGISGTLTSQTQINGNQIQNGTIFNPKIAPAAAIDWTKISKVGAVPSDIGAAPDFVFAAPLLRSGINVSLGTVTVPNGGLGRTSIPLGNLMFGNTANPVGYSANLRWDDALTRLCVAVPSSCDYTVDVNGTVRATTFRGALIGNVTGNSTSTDALTTTTGVVNVSAAIPPAVGYTLLATSATTAEWGPVGATSPWENTITPGLTQLVTGTDEVLIASTLQIGTYNAAQQNLLHIEQTVSTEPPDINTFVGIKTNLTADYPSTSSNFTFIGNETNLSTGSSFDNTAGVSSVLTAVSGITRYNAVAADTIENVQGGSFISLLTGDGTITYGDGLRAIAGISGGTGTVINARALVARTPSGATGAITNSYGLYIEDQKTAQVTNPFQIYSTGAAPSTLRSTAAAIIPLTLKVPDAQSTNTFLIENETGTDLFAVNSAGIITTGGYQGTAIGDTYISSAATWNAKISGSLTSPKIPVASGSGSIADSDLSYYVGKLDSAEPVNGRKLCFTDSQSPPNVYCLVTSDPSRNGGLVFTTGSAEGSAQGVVSAFGLRLQQWLTAGTTMNLGDTIYMADDGFDPPGGMWLKNGALIRWPLSGAADAQIQRDAAGEIGIYGSGTTYGTINTATYKAYGAFTDFSNYVRGSFSSTSTTINLVAETAGTGSDDVSVNITAAGTGTINLNSPIRGLQDITASTAGSGAPNVLTSAQSRSGWTNEGSTAENYHTLPTAAVGLTYTFCTQDVDGLRVTANTGDTIRISAGVTATAGYINSVDIGSCVVLVAINTTEWFATSSTGTWTIN